jgi:hypothetical protein
MKIIEDKTLLPPRKHYEDVDPKFTNFTDRCRVLPVNYYNEYNTIFTLKARYEPGENKYFPNGGFEVKHIEGGTYNYELDQVIVHPFELRMINYFSKSQTVVKEKIKDLNAPKGKRGRKRINPEGYKETYTPTGGQRGRKKLDPAVKAAKEAEKLAKRELSGGKRGRPKKQ